MRIGYFCTSGNTEIGSIQAFLRKINPAVEWERCYPSVKKPAPKIGRQYSIPNGRHSGVSGGFLVRMMLERLGGEYFEREKYDAILLIDDMDCRFYGQKEDAMAKYVTDLSLQVNQKMCRAIDLYVLFASPEIESWFVADWANSFAMEYPILQVKLRMKVNELLSGCARLEDYGGPLVNGSCAHKLSKDIQNALFDLQVVYEVPKRHSYSKRIHGAAMLGRIDPNNVAKKCTLYFAPVFRKLRDLT